MVSNLNFRYLTALFAFAGLFGLEACTKEIPIAPTYTGENYWAPSFTITFNNYQRISGTIERIPRLSLLRNIDSCVVQARSVSADSFVSIGNGAVPNPLWTGSFKTNAVLQMGQSYAVRLATFYRNGVVRYSIDTTITSPIVFGRIAKSIPVSSRIHNIPDQFWFNDGAIVCFDYSSGWWIEDTLDGSAQNIPAHFSSWDSTRFVLDGPVALSGDTVFFWSSEYTNSSGLKLLRSNFLTGWTDTSLVLEWSNGNFRGMAANGRKLGVCWGAAHSPEPDIILVEYDAGNGKVIDSSEISNAGLLYYFSPITYVGDELWVAFAGADGSNRIGRVDFSVGKIVDSHENPDLESAGLAWDGSSIWVLHLSPPYNFEKLLFEDE